MSTIRTRRVVAPLACALALGLAGTAHAGAFQSPSGNIGCYLSSSGARCDIAQHSWSAPARPKRCDLDWGGGLGVNRRGSRGYVVCAGDTTLHQGPRLAYGHRVRGWGMTCTSRMSGMTCRNARGHGFRLSRESYRLF